MPQKDIRRLAPATEGSRIIPNAMGDQWKYFFTDIESSSRIVIHGVKESLFSCTSRFQKVDIFNTDHLGKILALDEIIQVAQTDECLYHEPLVHPGACLIKEPKSALVMGGGDGCAVRELLKHQSIRDLRMVEIDSMVIESCQEHFSEINEQALINPGVTVIIDEAEGYLRGIGADKFDLIIADLTEPYDLAGISGDLSKRIFSPEFYGFVKSKISRDNGVFVIQTGGITFSENVDRLHKGIISGLRSRFGFVNTLYQYVHSFDMIWTITICSDTPMDLESFDPEPVLKQREITNLKYYDKLSHKAAVIAPRHIRDLFHK